jgi:heat-inducible transcriptional repressor
MSPGEWMNERKLQILRAVIDDYIFTAEPIGSRTIARRHELGLSSATIRNEMADLEEMGYLAQPHTSAGRIPSDKGYRLYVDQLLQLTKLTMEEISEIHRLMASRTHELQQMLHQMAEALSDVTGYTSMAAIPTIKQHVLRAVQVLPVEPGKLLVITVAEGGIIRNSLVRLPEPVPADMLGRLSRVLNEHLSGLTIHEITLEVIRRIKETIRLNDALLMPVLEAVSDCITLADGVEAYLEGTVNLLGQPEFNDPVRARELLGLLDDDNIIRELLDCAGANESGINVRIGTENTRVQVRDCSVVTARCPLGSSLFSAIGIIGPTRMDYGRVIAVMQLAGNLISREYERLFGNEKPQGSRQARQKNRRMED